MRKILALVLTVLLITTQTQAQQPSMNLTSQLTPQQQQQLQSQLQQAGQNVQNLVNNFLPQNSNVTVTINNNTKPQNSTSSSSTDTHSQLTPQQQQALQNLTQSAVDSMSQVMNQMATMMQSSGSGIQMGDNGLNTQNFQASSFQNKDQFNQFLSNMTQLANQLGSSVNKSQIDAQAKQLQEQYNSQIQQQFNNTSSTLSQMMQQFGNQQQAPQQFQDFQSLLQQQQSSGDVQGLQEAQLRLQLAQQQAQALTNNRESAQSRLQSFAQSIQQFAQGGNANQIISQMNQFSDLQMPGQQFQQFCENLTAHNVFNASSSAEQASQMLASLSQISSTQGNVDILAQSSTADAQGVQSAQRCMDNSRAQAQQQLAQFVGNGQTYQSAGMFFQGFNPQSITSNLTIGESGEVQMTLPPGLMQRFSGLSNVVAQISQQNPGEWDGVSTIANFAKGMIVDIKFFAGNNTQNVSGLSGSDALNFCIPLTNSSTDCSTVKCGYIDPSTSELKYDGVSTTSTTSYVPGSSTPCCQCTATHATSFTLVSSSAFSGKLMMMSLMGFLIAILALFFA